MGRTATKIAAIGLAVSSGLFGGCQVYLHDEALQKQTAAAVAAYKEADVPGAMKAAIAAQEKFDAQMLESIVAEDAAARDKELAELLDSGDVEKLEGAIATRLAEIGGPRARFIHEEWQDGLLTLDLLRSQLASNARVVNLVARIYRDAGGKGFTECKEHMQLHAPGESAALAAAALDLQSACDAWMPIAKSLEKNLFDFEQRVCRINRNSLLAESCLQIEAADQWIKADKAAAKSTKEALEKTRQELATEIAAGTPEERLTAKIEAFKAELDRADLLVADLRAPQFKPSAALAAIEFRETNLCDVLLAGLGTSCSGGKVDENARKTNEAVIGLIAGLSKVTGPPPRTDALSVALSYQSGLQRAAQASLDGQQAQRALLQIWQNALVQEVEYLLQSRSALADGKAGLATAACKATGLSAVLRTKGCPGRAALSNALTAYNLSWAVGRTAARAANARITMSITMTHLRIAQATAASRDEMVTTALAGLDAFGQGGVTTQTIAELLQALGIAAIANGVN